MSEHTPLPSNCTPWQRAGSYIRRHVPLLLALAVLVAYLFGPSLIEHLTFLVHGAAPLVPGGPDLDGAQVAAANQAGGWMQLGAVTSKIFAAVAYFCIGLFLVWYLMHHITPALPTWAKRDFTTRFAQLSAPWQFVVYLSVWLPLLGFFALCVLAASLAQ
jgi:hypothetical protein